MEHILVSACLLGENCKWDGGNNRNQNVLDIMKSMEGKAEFHAICPEQMGGLSTPRPASEICVCDGRVVNTEGADVTAEFERGAELALQIAKEHGCTCAILKERSPSCGCHGVYDGTFSKTLTDGMGKAAGLLAANGIQVFGETEMDSFMEVWASMEKNSENIEQKIQICEEIVRRHVEKVPPITSYRAVYKVPRFYLKPFEGTLSREEVETAMKCIVQDPAVDERNILAIYTSGPLETVTHCKHGMVFTDTEFFYAGNTKNQYQECRVAYQEIQKVSYKYRWFSERRSLLIQMTNGKELELDSEGAQYMADMLKELISAYN